MSEILYENGSPVYAIVNGKMVKVQEVRHGHWKGINRNKYNDDEATCSVCGVTFSSGYSDPSWWDYCPSCGAKMDEVEE